VKRTPLKRKTPMKRGGGSYLPYDRRSQVEWRCKGLCEAKTPACTGKQAEVHHILPRSAGGGHDLNNLLGVCRPCHRWIEDHRTISYERGWLRKRGPVRARA
jgi:5-methylcytosine-specific restriction endonuclease McrA